MEVLIVIHGCRDIAHALEAVGGLTTAGLKRLREGNEKTRHAPCEFQPSASLRPCSSSILFALNLPHPLTEPCHRTKECV